jgi:hypothetical protein
LTTKSRILSCAGSIDGCKAKKLHIVKPSTIRCIIVLDSMAPWAAAIIYRKHGQS